MPDPNPYAPPQSAGPEASKRADLQARRGADASLAKRLGGTVVDFIALFVGMTVLSRVFCALTGAERTFGLVQMFMLVGLVGQWFLIAHRGQTLGKLALRTRIVLADGQLPGFVRGVAVRQWPLFAVLMLPSLASRSLQPLASLVFLADALAIFAGSRCLHDRIAGTYVVDAR